MARHQNDETCWKESITNRQFLRDTVGGTTAQRMNSTSKSTGSQVDSKPSLLGNHIRRKVSQRNPGQNLDVLFTMPGPIAGADELNTDTNIENLRGSLRHDGFHPVSGRSSSISIEKNADTTLRGE